MPGLFAAVLAVIFAMGTVTAPFACNREVAAVVAISPPDDDCEHGPPTTSCFRSCVAICHAIAPAGCGLDRADGATDVNAALPTSPVVGLASGPEPPPPRRA